MNKQKFEQHVKGKTIKALLDFLEKGLSKDIEIDPDFLSIAFNELNYRDSRDFTVFEMEFYDKILALYSHTDEIDSENENIIDIAKVLTKKVKERKSKLQELEMDASNIERVPSSQKREPEEIISNIQKLFISINPNNKVLKMNGSKPTKTESGNTYNISIGDGANVRNLQVGNNNINYTNNEQRLVDKLENHGITREQANELIALLKVEKQDTNKRTLGEKVTNWCNNVKTIGLGVLSNLIFEIMYGLPPA